VQGKLTVLSVQAVLRCDVAPLLLLVAVHLLVTGRLSVGRALADGIVAFFGCLAATVPLDSLMWRRPVWPEGEVFWFNVVLNR
jgi:alpha-1,6-mannosyltransferase